MPVTRPLPTVIGPTENALRALLIRTLSATRIPDYAAWVVLNAVSNDPSGGWRRSAAAGLRAEPDEIAAVLAELVTAGLLNDGQTVSELGAAELSTARAAVSAATLGLVEGVDESELATTRRVLDVVRHRAEAALSA